jgi:hypothetical protein
MTRTEAGENEIRSCEESQKGCVEMCALTVGYGRGDRRAEEIMAGERRHNRVRRDRRDVWNYAR